MDRPELVKKSKSVTKRRIPFIARVEGAKEVIVTGDFTDWARDRIPMESAGNNEWSTTLELAPGEYRYRLVVDGEWQDHPEALKRVSNPFGTQDCVLIVS